MAIKSKDLSTQAKATQAIVPHAPHVEAEWEQMLGKRAKATKAVLTQGVPRITHKGGVLHINGQKVAGGEILCVILGMKWTKCHYAEEYSEGASDTPNCYAFGEGERGLRPHEAAPNKQAESCDACPHNVFGTALKGHGKRCQDKPRLLVLLANELQERTGQTVEHAIGHASHYQIEVPATSISGKGAEGMGLNKYVASLNEHTDHGDLCEAVTKITTEPRDKGGYFVVFEFMDKTPSQAMPYIAKRSLEAPELLAQPFPVITQAEQAEPKVVKGQARVQLNTKRR